MTCNVEILSVIGHVTDDDDEELYEIHVEGRIVDEEAVHIGETVHVTHDCYKREGIYIIVEADGTWKGDLPYIREEDESEHSEEPPCDCGLMIKIIASLSPVDGVFLCDAGIWEEVLECETKPLCPTINNIRVVNEGDCINGKRQVTLEAEISSANYNLVREYKWKFNVDVECTVNTTTNDDCDCSPICTATEQLIIYPPAGVRVEGDISYQTTGEILIPAPGDADVEIEASFTLTGNERGCSNEIDKTITITGCGAPCPRITDIDDVQRNCNKDLTKRYIYFVPHVDGAGVTEYIWDYGDGTIDNNGEHWYDLGANQEVTLTIIGPSSCPEIEPFTKTFEVKCERDGPCPDGEVWNPTTQKCEEPPTPPSGRSKKCCFLIYAWLVTFVSIWFVTEYIWALLSAIGTSITLLIIWFFLCKRCGYKVWKKKFWRCINPFTNCCFLRWTILGHKIALLVLGVAVIGGYYLPPWYVWLILTWGLAFWEGIWSWAKRKWKFKCEYPIPLDRSTWPPCKCRR